MAELSKAEKEAAKAEEARRAALTQEERDAEDLANLDAAQAAENVAKGQASGSVAAQRAALIGRMTREAKAARAKEATEEVTVARGRILYLEANQEEPHVGGDVVMVTPEEAAKLRAAGHITNPDKTVEQPVGPRVYQEAGLLVGHSAGQGQAAEGSKGSGKSSK